MRFFDLRFKSERSKIFYTVSLAIGNNDTRMTTTGAVEIMSEILPTMENVKSMEEAAKELRKQINKAKRKEQK